MAVAAAHEHQLAERARVEQLARLLQRRMIAMVEADAHQAPRRRARPSITASISATVRRRRLLDQHVLAGLQRAHARSPRAASLVVATMTMSTSARSIAGRQSSVADGARRGARQRFGARAVEIGAGDEPRAGQRRRALPADQAAADDGDARAHLPVPGQAAVRRRRCGAACRRRSRQVVAVRRQRLPTDPTPR